MDSLLKYLPLRLSHALAHQSDSFLSRITEIRLRDSLPFSVCIGSESFTFDENNELSSLSDGIITTSEDVAECLERLCSSSLYSFEETIKNGFIPLERGCRAGVCGEFTLSESGVLTPSRITAINIRVMHLKREFGKKLCLHYRKNGLSDTLVISPPSFGKTTLLRSVATLLCEGELGAPLKTAIVDERRELYVKGMTRGLIDVISGCPKGYAIELMTRTMSPDAIICDEISANECEAIKNSRGSGIVFIASIHSSSLKQALSRPFVRSLILERVFETFVVIKKGYSYDVFSADELKKI